MSSVRALLPPLCRVAIEGGRRAALTLPRGVEDCVIFAVVTHSETERGDSLGGDKGAAVFGEEAILPFGTSGFRASGDCERTSGSEASGSLCSDLSVVIPRCLSCSRIAADVNCSESG
jgi:hypothetical protein